MPFSKDKPTSIRLPRTPTTPGGYSSPYAGTPTLLSPVIFGRRCGSFVKVSLFSILVIFIFLALKAPQPFSYDHPRDFSKAEESQNQLYRPAPSLIPPKQAKLFSGFAIAVKTGKETALTRAPEQLLTFLKDVDNVMFLGESPNVTIGDIPVEDVCTHLYDKFDEKPDKWQETILKLQESHSTGQKAGNFDSLVPDEGSVGWKFDAHKNIPGQVY